MSPEGHFPSYHLKDTSLYTTWRTFPLRSLQGYFSSCHLKGIFLSSPQPHFMSSHQKGLFPPVISSAFPLRSLHGKFLSSHLKGMFCSASLLRVPSSCHIFGLFSSNYLLGISLAYFHQGPSLACFATVKSRGCFLMSHYATNSSDSLISMFTTGEFPAIKKYML